jgi:hypothetical protein
VGQLKQEDWEKIGELVEEGFDVNKRKFWARVKEMNGRSGKVSVGVVKGKGGELLVDAERRKERWREYFASLGQVGDESDKFDEGFKREVEGELQIMGLVSDECNNDVLDRPLVEDEVRKALSEVKNGKAPEKMEC